MARDIKEKYGYIAFDYNQEMQKSKQTNELDVSYQTCNGNNIMISSERFCCTEMLFDPQFNTTEED